MINLIFGLIVPFYICVGMLTLLYALIKDRGFSGTWKDVLFIGLGWPVVWFVIILFKTSD